MCQIQDFVVCMLKRDGWCVNIMALECKIPLNIFRGDFTLTQLPHNLFPKISETFTCYFFQTLQTFFVYLKVFVLVGVYFLLGLG